jgi:hypothetical protein
MDLLEALQLLGKARLLFGLPSDSHLYLPAGLKQDPLAEDAEFLGLAVRLTEGISDDYLILEVKLPLQLSGALLLGRQVGLFGLVGTQTGLHCLHLLLLLFSQQLIRFMVVSTILADRLLVALPVVHLLELDQHL